LAREVDQHVVEMVFDNDKFEQNARTTMSTLDKLKEKLGFGDASDGFDKLDDAANRVDLTHLEDSVDKVSSRFSSLGVIGMTALQNIANKAVQLGEQIVNALVFDAPKAGFQEYELQQNTIQTILSATGEELKTVKDQLDQLNEYADKTIYVFSDMTQNISKFTNQGIDLETSVDAIKGISNLAADAGASAQQASHAMYNFAQALGAGSVKLIDWKSIQNATMDTVDFKNVLIQMGGALGTVQKELDETGKGFRYFTVKEKTTGSGKNKKTTYEKEYITAANFMQTLQKGWLTNDVLLKSLAVYAGEVSEELLYSMGFTETQVKEMMELGKRANEAATKIKTATQMVDTWREAAGTGWAKSFEYIFGDFDEATELFTSIGHKVGDELDRMSDARNNFLKGWHENGGYKNFVSILNGLVDAGLRLKDVAGRGFLLGLLGGDSSTDVFKGALDFTEKIKMAVDSINKSLKPNGATDSLYAVLIGIAQGGGGVLSVVLSFLTSLGSAIGKLTVMLDPFLTSVRWIVHMAGAWIADIARFIKQNKVFENTFNNILLLLRPAVNLINKIGVQAAKAFSAFRNWVKENHVFEKAWNVLTFVLGLAALAINKIALTVPRAYKKVKEFLKGVWSGVSQWAKPAFDWINEKFTKFSDIGEKIQKGDFSGVVKFFSDLVDSFNQGVEDAKKWFDENIASNPIYQGITGFFGGIVAEIAKFFTTDSEGKEIVFSKDATWWDKVEGYFHNGVDKATQWLTDNVEKVLKPIREFFSPITNAISNFFTPEVQSGYKNGHLVSWNVTWWDKIKNYFVGGYNSAVAWWNKNAQPVVDAVGKFFQPIISAIYGFFSPEVQSEYRNGNLVSWNVTWWDKIKNYFVRGYSEAKAWWDKNAQPIVTAVGNFFQPIISAIYGFFSPQVQSGYQNGNLVSWNVTWWDKIKNYFVGGYDAAKAWLEKNFGPVVKVIGEFFAPIINAASNFFTPEVKSGYQNGHLVSWNVTWWDKIKNYFVSGYEKAKAWLEKNFGPVVDAVEAFFEPIRNAIGNFFASDDGENGESASWWEKITDIFQTGIDSIDTFFKGLADSTVVQSIKGFFGDIKKAINNIFGGEKKDNKLLAAFGMSASDVFGPRGTKEMHDALYPEKTWWEQLIEKFREGIIAVWNFFATLPDSPVIQAIGDFFARIVEKAKDLFGSSTDENGNKIHWWNRLISYFIRGRNEVVKWLQVNVLTNPIYKSISDFFSAIIAKIREFFTTEIDSEGNETTWWERIKKIFTDGIEFLTGWFGTIKDKEPIKSIREFFAGIGKAIGDTIKNGFGTYTKVTHLGDHEEDIIETFPWYQRFIDVFKSGLDQIKSWFATLAENNPIIAAVRNFFINTWAKISGIFTGENGEFDFKSGATTILTSMQDKLAGFVENLKGKHGELSGKTSDVMKAVTDYVSGLFKTDKSTEKKIENDKQGPITLIGLVSNVFQLMFEAVALMWQGLSDIIGKMKFDALWDFLDHLVTYWNAFTLGNAVGAVKNITEILSFKMRVELIEDLAKLFGAMALLAGVVAGFATLPEDQVKVGFGFLASLVLIIIGLMAYTHHLDKVGSDSTKAAKNVEGITNFTNSLAQTFGGAAFLAAITALASAASGALNDIVKLGMEGANADDIWSAIGYLAATLAVLFIFANGGSILTKLIGNKIGSSLGFNLNLSTMTQGGDNSFIEKAMELSSTGLDNLTNVAALALSLKAVTGAIKEIHDLMKEQGWHDITDASSEMWFLTALIGEVLFAFNTNNIIDTIFDRRIADKNVDRETVKKGLADALESAANILAIAQAVKMLVEALEPIVRLESIYGEQNVIEPAMWKLNELLGAVLAVFQANEWLGALMNKYVGAPAVSDTSTKGIIAAIVNNPVIAMAGSVWILVQALVSLINATKQIPEGMSFELYLGKIEELLGYVLGADSIMTLVSGAASKLGNGKGGLLAIASAGILFGGVAFILTQIKDLMNIIPDQYKLDQFNMAALKIGEIVSGLLLSLAGTEGVASLASKLDMAAIGKLSLLILGLGLLTGGTIWATGHAAEGFGTAFDQISEGVIKIKNAITDMGDEDIKKLESFGKAVGALGEAQAAVSGAKYGGDFLSRLLSHWFGLDATNGENLETLGQYTEGFAEHIPAIIEKIKGINDDIQAFEAFIGFIQNLASLMYLSNELTGGWELEELGQHLLNTTGNLGGAVSNLAGHQSEYEAAMTGLMFIQELTELAKNFNADEKLADGLDSIADSAFQIAISDVPSKMALIVVEMAKGLTDNEKTILSQVSSLLGSIVRTMRGKYSEFYTAGRYVSQGFANGITSLEGNERSPGTAYYAGYHLAQTALNGINAGAGISSPSREAYICGEYVVAGFANAMRDESYIAYDEGLDLATASIDGMRSALSDDLASSLEDDFLTIRPVMDMSDIQNGMDTIDAYTHGYRDFSIGGWRTQNSQLQNGSFGSYSTLQASRINNADINAYIPYDDYRVVAGLNGLNNKMDSIDQLVDKINNLQLVLDSGLLVGGIANKMNRRLGVIATREERRS